MFIKSFFSRGVPKELLSSFDFKEWYVVSAKKSETDKGKEEYILIVRKRDD